MSNSFRPPRFPTSRNHDKIHRNIPKIGNRVRSHWRLVRSGLENDTSLTVCHIPRLDSSQARIEMPPITDPLGQSSQRTMGCLLSTPEFYHPDLLAVLTEHKGDRAKPWHITPLLKIAPQLKAPDRPHSADWSRRQSKRPRDLDWSRNSPVANELVDTLNGALEDMGGCPFVKRTVAGASITASRWQHRRKW